MSGTPSSTLRDRVRSSVAQAPEARAPYWIAAVAAVVMAVLIVGILFVANPLRRAPVNSGPPATQSPFACASSSPISSSTAPAVAYINDVRTGTHSGYDRLTVEFKNGAAAEIDVSPQSGTNFTLAPSGLPATLAGQNGILVTIHGSDLPTDYSGATDIKTGYPALVEIRRVEDLEGVVQLGLGINGPACYRALPLNNPSRLVIDIQASS